MASADILIVDDDVYYASESSAYLEDYGKFEVHRAYSVDAAISAIKQTRYRLVIMDVRMPPGATFDAVETAAGHKTGVVLARTIRNSIPGVKLLVHTGSHDHNLEVWFAGNSDVSFVPKSRDYRPLLRAVNAALNPGFHNLKSFIVHGRDRGPLHELSRFLTKLGFPDPMVLSEMPSSGLTLIEKFEHYASQADVVFVLLTPDDMAGLAGSSAAMRPRARQNVLFEVGYFLGSLRRHSGRVLLLHRGDIEIPSDIAGLVYVDIEHGIEAAGEQLRRELAFLH
jgi:predicted nucleotide-binding protein